MNKFSTAMDKVKKLRIYSRNEMNYERTILALRPKLPGRQGLQKKGRERNAFHQFLELIQNLHQHAKSGLPIQSGKRSASNCANDYGRSRVGSAFVT